MWYVALIGLCTLGLLAVVWRVDRRAALAESHATHWHGLARAWFDRSREWQRHAEALAKRVVAERRAKGDGVTICAPEHHAPRVRFK